MKGLATMSKPNHGCGEQQRRPAGVDDAVAEAAGKLSEEVDDIYDGLSSRSRHAHGATLMARCRHVYENELKQQQRTHGRSADEARSAGL